MPRYRSLEEKRKSHQKAFAKYGVDPRALQWRSKKSAELRHRQLIADLIFEGKTILDVGCGFGDIISYIEKSTNNFKYVGVDIVPEFIEVCKKKYPQFKFVLRDYFTNPLKKDFDIIISSGTLNSNIENPYGFRKKAIKTLFKYAKEALVFNMAGGYPQPENKEENKVYYVDSLKILKYCMTLTSKLILRSHYHKKGFTIVMYKMKS